ncbi:MAG: hypothetical protein LBE36_02825 [Flavobacteriaceae bacterium]|nr:hypothetical protein [Flavobacteriaceae bacterium]
MNKTQISGILCLLFSQTFSFAQNKCDCEKAMSFVQKNIEKNSASFQHRIIENRNKKEYQNFKKNINQISKKLTTQKECVGLMSYYLSFFKDTHQFVGMSKEYYKPFDALPKDSLTVYKFLRENVENIPIKYENNKDSLEGDWFYKFDEVNADIRVHIQKNTEKGKSYVGLISKPLKYYAEIGDLKIDFYNRNHKLYAVFWNMFQAPSRAFEVSLDNGVLKIGKWYYFVRDKKDVVNFREKSDSTFVESLSDKTNYLRVKNFYYEEGEKIDSLLKSNHQLITAKENLIIDIRNNPGGSDYGFLPILPYIMDSKIYNNPIKASTWVSKENFKFYDESKYEYGVETKQDSIAADHEIRELKKYLNKFEPADFTKDEIDTVYSFPKKIYIITNRNNASSAEDFILRAKQSSKVKIIGQYTMGALSYGEIREIKIPNFPASLYITQRKMSFYNNEDFETIGLKPDIILDENKESEWKNITLKLIEEL